MLSLLRHNNPIRLHKTVMTTSLFNRLLKLYPSPVPEEDYFTELIAWLWENNQQLFFSWLKDCVGLDFAYSAHRIRTQVDLPRLEGHATSSRPDFLIFLYADQVYDVVMLESKLGATEGYEQLPRYADQLSNVFPEARNRYLVYITRSYEPKNPLDILRDNKNTNVQFIQTRWYQFHQLLQKQPAEPIINEVLRFMKEKRMATITKITPSVLMAINAYPDVYNFFHTVLDDDVISKFTEIIGVRPRSEANRIWNVAELRRYLLIGDLNPHQIFYTGFVMPDTTEKFASIKAWFEIRPSDPNREKHIQICKKAIADSGDKPIHWTGYNLDQPDHHAGISSELSIEEVLAEPDHVFALKQKFLEFIFEFENIRNNYPDLLIK
ncbi:MAG: hypothetical protein GYA71_02635 [Bacteroidales bacterium]|nr:hypothetical protein [Bacteroidales bacterium]